MKQTISQKILTILSKQEVTNPKATFNKKLATRKFRNDNDIHGVVMRRARELASNKLLRRVSPGEYALTAKGRKAVK